MRSSKTKDEVAVVRAAYSLTLSRDDAAATAGSIAAFLELLSPDAVFRADDGAELSGRSELRRALETAAHDWRLCRFELAGAGAADDERILAFGSVIGATGPGEPKPIAPFANLWTLQQGLVTRIDAFPDCATAVREGGLD
jgi:hypothetical protein